MNKIKKQYSILGLCVVILTGISVNGQEVSKIKFIDYFFEHASPLNWEIQNDSTVKILLMYDFERESPNRAAGHWYFKVISEPGTHLRLIISNMDNVWNGKKAKEIGNVKEDIATYISYDNENWTGLKTTRLPNKEVMVDFVSEKEEVFIARVPPYTTRNLERLFNKIDSYPEVKIINIGSTVEKRPLEIIRLGNPQAKHAVLIRARAHPWESGGNWLLEGLIDEYLQKGLAKKNSDFCLYLFPMANKDGVVRGMTRFNLKGKDLNRGWNRPADPELCPENYALESFVKNLIYQGNAPDLYIDIHNDDWGRMSIRQNSLGNEEYIAKVKYMQKLLETHTHFAEAVRVPDINSLKQKSGASPSSIYNQSIFEKNNIDRITFELNANWLKKLQKIPSSSDWVDLGRNFNYVLYDYLTK